MKRILATAVAITSAALLTACSGDDSGMGNHGMDGTSADANSADVMFAQMMVPHHEQAIEMSDVLLAKDGVDPEVVDLAEQIKAAQGPEIEQMNEWLDEWGADMAGGMDHGDGMMSEADMEALADADGASAGDLYLEQMIEHHEGAIDMAESEVSDGKHEGAVAMAESIVETQTAEIATMQDMLAG
ncbi:DUF305 domain-containing protein [Antribacter sp. KLBMP9083]|uniref:DUF305 domain-containing protein n=1 Tax=Antribacter soli TaxID=2910976 RepID=A0AA41QD37_9MICO|nr:DUF305 domain-containing protein [Antribacter soli]MCF4120396.1 DUF305 domain-containing protein [Antribacter soli]